MRFSAAICCLATILSGSPFSSSLCGAEGSAPLPDMVGQRIDAFTLRDYRGVEHSLSDFDKQPVLVVVFLGAECPLATAYAPRVQQLADRYAGQGVAVLGIDANSQDSISDIAAYAKEYSLGIPLLKDVGNVVADRFGARRTPHAFVLDQARVVRYAGRIDDQFGVGVRRNAAGRDDLAAALDELLAGKEVSVPRTEPAGCLIGRVREPKGGGDVTYSGQVARIFQDHCVACHRPGEVAPFSLTSYDEAAGWADTIAEVVAGNRMPPWHADPQFGHFANDARLSDDEKDQLFRWVKAGAPQGDPSELPPPKTFAAGWQIPTPDCEVFMADEPYQVPAEGEVKYQYFEVDPGFAEDKWVQAAQCKPGNRAVVHHIIVYVRPRGALRRGGRAEVESDWLTAMAPGTPPMILQEGLAKYVPAGSTLVFQMHYTPNGSPQTDRSSVGLVFADPASVHKEVGTWRAATQNFAIPPGADGYEVEAWHTFPQDALLLRLFPHMHLRGKSFRFEAQYPDGTSEVLLDVPHYDFNWQNSYELAEPKRLPAGTRMHCTAQFDNSASNPANPDPDATVRWGDQTWEEMMIGYFDMALADQDLKKGPQRLRTERFLKEAATAEAALDEEFSTLAKGALESQEAFARFGEAVMRLAPQVDRVCLTTIGDGKLRVDRSVHCAELARLNRGRKLEFDATFLALTKYAAMREPTVHQDFNGLATPDFQLLGRVFGASMHVPVRWEGRQGTLNFWSRELDAFPPEAVKLLEAAAHKAAGPLDPAP